MKTYLILLLFILGGCAQVQKFLGDAGFDVESATFTKTLENGTVLTCNKTKDDNILRCITKMGDNEVVVTYDLTTEKITPAPLPSP